jgi:hypothetical protein
MSIDTIAVPVPQAVLDSPIPFDLYREVHKGLRLALFDLTVAVGRADLETAAARADVVTRTQAVIRLLHAHHGHEDVFIQPLVEAGAGRLASVIEDGHTETEQDLLEIEARLERLTAADDEDGVRVGQELYGFLALFTARYLAHMALEEGSVMQALRDAFSLEELFGCEVAIRSTVAPPLMVEFMAFMLPAMNTGERTSMLGGMKAGAPPEIFELFRCAAADALSADDYAVVATRIGVA